MSLERAKRHIDYQIAEFGIPDRYRGPDWWQLSEAEEDVFGLVLEDMPRLLEVWVLYEDAIDITSYVRDTSIITEIREVCDWLTPLLVDRAEWTRFSKLFGVPRRLAEAYYDKWFWYNMTRNMATFRDEG